MPVLQQHSPFRLDDLPRYPPATGFPLPEYAFGPINRTDTLLFPLDSRAAMQPHHHGGNHLSDAVQPPETSVAPVRSFWSRILPVRGIAWVAPLIIYYLIQSVVIKALELSRVQTEAGLGDIALAWLPDLQVATFLFIIFGVMFSLAGRRLRIAGYVVFVITMVCAIVLNAASYAYFDATGANLSWSTIDYWLNNFQATNQIVSAGHKGASLYLMFGQLILVGILAALPMIGPVARLVEARPSFRPRTTVTILAASIAVWAGLFAVPTLDGLSMALSRSFPADIASDFMADKILAQETVEITEPERLDSSLEFKAAPDARRLNVVFILFESLRWNTSDAYTPGLGTTPFLEELARDGMLVENHYSIVPHTTKAVMAANCAIYPYLDTEPKEAAPGILPRRCLAHILKNAGYSTAFFQPAGNFEKRDLLVANMGYDVYRGHDDMPQEGFEETNYFGREERMMIEPSMRWVDSVKDKGPFLLTYLTLSTHHNYVSPQSFPYVDYDVEDTDLRNYMNAVRYTDQFIREVFDEFKKRGLLDNTLFVIVGDHGEAFGEHGRRQHDLILWEEGLHSFSLLYAPGNLPGGTRVTGARSHLDLIPTITDVLGLDLVKGDLLGSSMLKPVPEDRTLFFGCWFKRRCLGMREGSIKTIYHYDQMPMEVYDNSTDPYDKVNLAMTGPYDAAFLDARKQQMLRFEKVTNQQYREWEQNLVGEAVSDSRPEVATSLPARFADDIELVGVDEIPKSVQAGQDIRLRYVFKALDDLPESASMFVHVVHQDGTLNADHVPVRGALPLDKWETGKYITDEHIVHIPGNWSGGKARVLIGFWDRKTGKRFKISGTSARINDERLEVGVMDVSAGARSNSPTIEALRERIKDQISFDKPDFGQPVGAVFGDAVELAGVTLSRTDVHLAGTVEMTYVFKSLKDNPGGWNLTVQLIREDGVAIDGDHAPIGGLYPPRNWRSGEYVTDRHRIHIDMHLCKPGTYTAWLGFKSAGKPVPVALDQSASGHVQVDSLQRVKLGTVIIRPGEKK